MVNRFAWSACRLVGVVQPRGSSLAVWWEAQHNAGGSREYLRLFSPLHFRRCVARWRIQWMVLCCVVNRHSSSQGKAWSRRRRRRHKVRNTLLPSMPETCPLIWPLFHQNNFNSSLICNGIWLLFSKWDYRFSAGCSAANNAALNTAYTWIVVIDRAPWSVDDHLDNAAVKRFVL